MRVRILIIRAVMHRVLSTLVSAFILIGAHGLRAESKAGPKDGKILRETVIERAVAAGVPKASLLRIFGFLDKNMGKQLKQDAYYCRRGGPESFEACPIKSPDRIPIVHSLTVIDHGYAVVVNFGQPSTEKRLYVIELATGEVWKTYTAHGRGSGRGKWAYKFSNTEGSFQSSLGLYMIGGTYNGHYKKTLRMYGLESSNDQAYLRDIVMHPAEYAEEASIFAVDRRTGEPRMRLGLSLGCPAVSKKFAKTFFPALENGAIVDVYHPELMEAALSGKEVRVTPPEPEPSR